MAQNAVFASLAVAIGVAAACIADLAIAVPFGGQVSMDVIFLLCSGIVGWMGVDCLKGMRKR